MIVIEDLICISNVSRLSHSISIYRAFLLLQFSVRAIKNIECIVQ